MLPPTSSRFLTALSVEVIADATTSFERRNTVWQYIETTIAAHGGRIHQRSADQLTALWGLPRSGTGALNPEALTGAAGGGPPPEESTERVVRAALAVQQTIRNLKITTAPGATAVRIRQAAHTGPLVGSAVEVFQPILRPLLQRTPAGQLGISLDAYRLVRGVFDVQPDVENDQIISYQVLEAKTRAFRRVSPALQGIETRTMGREAELQRLQTTMRAVIDQRKLQAITIVAEPGLGKSRLVYEFDDWLDLLPDSIWLFRGRANEETRRAPYALLRDIFAFRFEILETDSPPTARAKFQRNYVAFLGNQPEALLQAHFVGHLIGLDFSDSPHIRGLLTESKQIHDHALHYFAQLFIAATRQNPAILVIDDMQWADDSSVAALRHLLQVAHNAPLLVLFLARPELYERWPEWDTRTETTPLALPPLSPANLRKLLNELLRHAPQVSEAFRANATQCSQGNPLYLEELVRWLVDRGDLKPGAPEWEVSPALNALPLPTSLANLLQARWDDLHPEERSLLQRASVIGRLFWDQTLIAVRPANAPLSPMALAERLEMLTRKEFLMSRTFSVFPGTRAYLFKNTGVRQLAYASLPPADQHMYHAQIANWLAAQSQRVAGNYGQLIAEQYEQAGEITLAAEWFGRAGDQLRQTCAANAAASEYERALALGHAVQLPAHQLLRWHMGLAETLHLHGASAEAQNAYRAMLATAEAAQDLKAQAQALNGLAVLQTNHTQALESAQRAEKIARQALSQKIDANAELLEAFYHQGWALEGLGDLATALGITDRLLARLKEAPPPLKRLRARSLNLAGVINGAQGRFEMSDYYREQALAIFQELGDRRMMTLMLNNLAENARLRGNYASAIARYQEPLRLAREIGSVYLESLILSNLGGARAGAGNYAAAEVDLQRALALMGQEPWQFAAETCVFLGQTYLGQGKPAEALHVLRKAQALAEHTEDSSAQGLAWRALAQVRAAHPSSDSNLPAARACFEKSAKIFAAIGNHQERARVLRAWAHYELKQGDLPRSKALRAEARELFARLDLQNEVERMDNE
jgi:predicted ATPase